MQAQQDGGARLLRSYAYYADICKEHNIPLQYERGSKHHKKGQFKTKEALRQCIYQKERKAAKAATALPSAPVMRNNPMFKQSFSNAAYESSRSSSPLSSFNGPSKNASPRMRVHDNYAFEMMQANPLFKKKATATRSSSKKN
jgi:hypothetical protein